MKYVSFYRVNGTLIVQLQMLPSLVHCFHLRISSPGTLRKIILVSHIILRGQGFASAIDLSIMAR